MRVEIRQFHSLVLQAHSAIMFESLIYPHHVITTSAAQWVLEDKEGLEQPPIKGYFAMKDVAGKKTKYFIPDYMYPELPIRVDESEEMLFRDSSKKKSIVIMPTEVTPFRVKAEQVYKNNHNFIDALAPFQHSNPEMWTLNKIIAVMGYVGKTFVGVCSAPEFGKSSIYSILDSITKKCPVYQPRSVAGVLAQITSDGNMIFDEPGGIIKEVKKIMENFSLMVAGNNPIYINGALKSKDTKPKYDVAQQSITYLYNLYSNYANPDKEFFDYLWADKAAMDSRFLRLKMDGILTETFSKDFDIVAVAERNKMFYMKIAKHLLWLKHLKITNGYVRRYNKKGRLNLKGRHKIIFDEITWGLDIYCDMQEEYDKYFDLLEGCIISYKEMLGDKVEVKEEQIEESDNDRILKFIKSKGEVSYEDIAYYIGKNVDGLIKELLGSGDVFENKPGKLRVLE